MIIWAILGTSSKVLHVDIRILLGLVGILRTPLPSRGLESSLLSLEVMIISFPYGTPQPAVLQRLNFTHVPLPFSAL